MRSGLRRGLAGLALGGLAFLWTPAPVSAHALPQSSVPAAGSTVSQAPAVVTITFGETPDPPVSGITVLDHTGASVDAGSTVVAPGDPLTLEVRLRAHLPDGVYLVNWHTVSAVDGHLAAGSFSFGLGVPATTVPASASVTSGTSASPPAIAARLALFLGLIGALGFSVFAVYGFAEPPWSLRVGLALAGALAMAGTLAVVAVEASAAGIGLGLLFSASLGRTLIARAVPAVMLLAASCLLLQRGRSRPLYVLCAVAALAAMGVDVVSSHAGAQSIVPLNIAAQWAHIAAVGVWIGGLGAFALTVAHADSDSRLAVAQRLSRLAGVGLVLVAMTGVIRAAVEVQSLANLFGTLFGVLVVVKVGLLLLLAAIGAWNRYGNIPRLPQRFPALRRAVSAEIVIAVAAISIAAALVNVAPPSEYAGQQTGAQAPVVATASDFATTVKVRLTVDPGSPGENSFTVDVTDYDTGQPVAASGVLLTFSSPLRPGIPASTLLLTPAGATGRFSARGGNMALPGIWEVAAVIERGNDSTEVHFQLGTAGPLPQVQTSVVAGSTLYTVPMSPSVSAQIYIDPDHSGATEFHVTFFDASGNEARIPGVVVGMTAPGQQTVALVTRPLDPVGHYVADVTLPTGTTRFDVIATTSSGAELWTYVDVTPR